MGHRAGGSTVSPRRVPPVANPLGEERVGLVDDALAELTGRLPVALPAASTAAVITTFSFGAIRSALTGLDAHTPVRLVARGHTTAQGCPGVIWGTLPVEVFPGLRTEEAHRFAKRLTSSPVVEHPDTGGVGLLAELPVGVVLDGLAGDGSRLTVILLAGE